MPVWNWQKIKQMLSNTLRLNFRYLGIIYILHPRYHPKVIEDILKKVQKASTPVWIRLYDDNENEAKMENRSHRHDMNR